MTRQTFICSAMSTTIDTAIANAKAAPSWTVKVVVWVMKPGPMAEVAMRNIAPSSVERVLAAIRPVPAAQVVTAVQVTARMPQVHGAPVHVGSPEQLGITDLATPDFGEAVEAHEGDVPVFWACGVTPQAALMASRPPFAITHAPGHMLVTDVPDTAYREA